jgi:tetratricopeptide (TPR) repeat protein
LEQSTKRRGSVAVKFPLSLIINSINSMNGYILLLAGQDDLAIEQLRKTLEIDPSFAHAYWELAIAYVRIGRFAEAISEFQRATTLSPSITQYKDGLGHATRAQARTRKRARCSTN